MCGWYEKAEVAAIEGSEEDSGELDVSWEEGPEEPVSTFVSASGESSASKSVDATRSSP